MEAHQADQTVARTLKIAIVGGGPACRAFLEVAQRLSGLKVEVLGVADPDPQAPGLAWARSQGIFTCQDMTQLYGLEGLDLLIELTGSSEVRGAIAQGKPPHLPLVDHDQARLFADIHHRQLAAGEQLLASKVFYETVVNAIHDEITIIGGDLRIVDANEALLRRLGRPREEVVGDYCYHALFGREARCEEPCPVCQTLQSGLPSEAIKSIPGPDGTEAFFRVVGFPLRDAFGAVSAVIGIARDITARKRSELALQESERRYRALADNAIAGIFRSTLKGEILYVNQALATMLGYERPEELCGRQSLDFYVRPRQRHRMLVGLKAHGRLSGMEIEARTKQGEARTFLGSASLQGEAIEGMVVDITGRKQAEEARRHSEERHRRLVENIPDVTWTADEEGKTVFVSANVEKVYGYTPGEIYEDGAALWLGRIHPEDVERVTEAYRRLFEVGEPFDVEYRIQRKDGAWIWLHDRAVTTYEKDGVRYAYGLFCDITERKLTADALRESERRYRALVDNATVGVFRVAQEGEILYVNQALLSMMGFERPEEVLGRKDVDFYVNPAQCEAVHLRLEAQGQVSGVEIELFTKQGEARTMLLSVSLRGEVSEGMLVDITGRKRVEEALRESEQKYRLLIENIPDITWAADRDGRVVFVSPNVERITGYTPTDIYENPDSWLGNVYPDDLERVSEAHRLLFEGHTFDVQYRFRCKDGHWIWVHDRAVTTYEKDGVRYAYGLFCDITERQRTDEALREREEQFRALVESTPDWVWEVDPEGRYTYASPQVRDILGYEPEEVLGRSYAEFLASAEEVRCISPVFEEAVRHQSRLMALENVCRHKDGRRVVLETSAVPVFDAAGRLKGYRGIDRDITERKRADEALGRSETLLRHIFSAIPDLLTVHDRDLNVVLSNWHGHDFIPEEVRSGHPKCHEAYMRRETPCEPCHAQEVFDTGTPKRFEINNPVDGLTREVNVYPVFDEAGRVVMVAEHMRDITERCRTEKRLVDETRFTEGIVDGCPVAMFVVDRDHKLVYWNRACEELTGLSREQMVGTNRQWEPWYYERRPVMADLVVDGDAVRLQQLYANQGLAPAPFVRDAYKGEGYFEKLGRHLYFLAAPVFDEQGQVLGAIETIQDVTETKRLESRLHDYSRDLERTIAELESKTRKLEAQEASQRAYSELLKILNSIDINQILRRSLQRVVEQANCQLGLIYLRETPEAELKLMAAYSVDAGALDSPILQPGGGLPAKVVQEMRPVIIRDVSPEARLSFYLGFARATPRTVVGLPLTFRDQVLGALVVASLESLEAETISFLENCLRQVSVAINNALAFAQIERQSQELADINRELAEASRLKSEFVANMSHELRTPLNSILGFSDILLKNKEGNLSERQVGNVEKIRRNGANLLSLINSILDLSKAEAGKIEAASEPTNLRQVVEECVESVRPLADKSGLALVLEPVEELPIVRSDPAKIGQVLMNLLSNAIKFTEEGRISVRVRKRRRREDPFEIAVEDTGIGIAPQHLDDIFKEFKQLDGAADRRYPGTGLGLTISKRLAELLGGEILVESEVGKGSTFTLRLPVRRHEEPALTPARKPLAAALAPPRLVSGRKQVLVIGADADAAQLAEAQAEQLGCEVSVCASGQEGLRRAAEMAPDAVVLDLAVPDRNGWEVLGELKGKEPTRDLPVVAVSGGDDRKRAFYLGASEFVAKPVEPEQFRSALARVLRPGRGRILVVDDEPEYLEAIREWLGDSVGEVCPARNGVEALRQLEARKPDAVFLDLMMPQMDGFELLKQIRSLEGCADIPVVVVTGKHLGEAELARIQDGATSVIQKGLTAQAQVMQQLERIVARLH